LGLKVHKRKKRKGTPECGISYEILRGSTRGRWPEKILLRGGEPSMGGRSGSSQRKGKRNLGEEALPEVLQELKICGPRREGSATIFTKEEKNRKEQASKSWESQQSSGGRRTRPPLGKGKHQLQTIRKAARQGEKCCTLGGGGGIPDQASVGQYSQLSCEKKKEKRVMKRNGALENNLLCSGGPPSCDERGGEQRL